MPAKLYPRTALALLTAINFINYIDRSVLFSVQPLVQADLHFSDTQYGLLTTGFFVCYMAAAPFFGVAGDRYPRKRLVFAGILIWSGATFLTAIATSYTGMLVRHTLVGVGEASYATIAPALVADLFPEQKRGRMLAIFYLAIPVGTAMGYILGGYLGHRYGWRTPFYVAAVPGFLLALAFLAVPEPERGRCDHLLETPDRATLLGLARNPAFWTATLGMAMVTFALGGVSVFMPKFLSSYRGMSLHHANLFFGVSTALTGVFGTLFGGWLGDRLLRRTNGAYYLVPALGLLAATPITLIAIYVPGRPMLPAIVAAEFLLLMNTGPLNAAIVNSVGASIRASAIGINLIVIHLLGDALSPPLMGFISDRSSLPLSFVLAVVAIMAGAAVLIYGMRFAPPVRPEAGLLNPISAES